jgi:ATP phosphoribosyltransferase
MYVHEPLGSFHLIPLLDVPFVLLLQAAGLEVVAEIFETESILISNPHSEHKDLVDLIKRRVEGYITAQKYVMISYNVTDDLMDKALTITPGKKSPNVTTLADGAKAITCLINKKEVVKKMDELEEVGATDILTFELSNTRM